MCSPKVCPVCPPIPPSIVTSRLPLVAWRVHPKASQPPADVFLYVQNRGHSQLNTPGTPNHWARENIILIGSFILCYDVWKNPDNKHRVNGHFTYQFISLWDFIQHVLLGGFTSNIFGIFLRFPWGFMIPFDDDNFRMGEENNHQL